MSGERMLAAHYARLGLEGTNVFSKLPDVARIVTNVRLVNQGDFKIKKTMKYSSKKFRWIHFLTLHSIHHIQYSQGYKIPFFPIAYFPKFGWKKMKKDLAGNTKYHNCTITGRY